MEFELRTIFLVIGVVVLAAILIHGLISIRKTDKPIDVSTLDLSEEDEEGNKLRDQSGFDRHGVGVARVIKSELDSTDEIQVSIKTGDVELVKAPEISVVETDENMAAGGINFDVALDNDTSEQSIVNTDDIDEKAAAEDNTNPLQAPVIAESESDDNKMPESARDIFESPVHKGKTAFLEPKITIEPPAEQQSVKTASSEPVEPLDVLVLNVVAGEGGELSGAKLLPILLTLGFKFGEMDIFHRYQDAAGHGEVLFSLANMVKPGVFDIDNMEQFTTTGISLFMTLPHNQGNMETFNIMLNAAAKIAEEFSGQVLDGNRSTLTKQSTQHYVQRIREVERKVLLQK